MIHIRPYIYIITKTRIGNNCAYGYACGKSWMILSMYEIVMERHSFPKQNSKSFKVVMMWTIYIWKSDGKMVICENTWTYKSRVLNCTWINQWRYTKGNV